MRTVRATQEKETDIRIIARVVRNLEEKNVGTKGNSPKQDLTSARDITRGLLEVRESPYHILD